MTPQTRVARLLCLLALSTFVTTPASAGPFPQQRAGYVSVWNVRDVTGCQQIVLQVSRSTEGATGLAASLFVSYDVYDTCQNVSVAFGWGFLPDAGFTLTGGSLTAPGARATFRLTIPANAERFFSEGPVGTIDLTFTPTAARYGRFSGTEQITEASGTVVTDRIAWSEVSATVDGHLLDTVIVAGEATLGSNKSRTRVQ